MIHLPDGFRVMRQQKATGADNIVRAGCFHTGSQ